MKTLKDLLQQRKDAQARTGPRTSISAVLVLLGMFLITSIAFILSFFPIFKVPGWIVLVFAGVFLALLIFQAYKYSKNPRLELEGEKPSRTSMIGSIAFLVLLLLVIFFGFAFFIAIARDPWFNNTGNISVLQRNRFVGAQFVGMILYFSSTPFIIVLWYRTAPRTAVDFILKFHRMFKRKGKKKVNEIIVIDMPQTHSTTISIKRAFDALLFSLFTTFTIYIPILTSLGDAGFPIWPIFRIPPLEDVTTIYTEYFIQYCTGYLMNLVTPIILSFVIFFWALPPTYLLDDGGVVFYRRFKKRRQPTEIKTVSSWFLSMVKGVVGFGGLSSYAGFIINNSAIIGIVARDANPIVATQFGLFILGMPFFGALLMAYFLMLFQENHFIKLKTALYQKLAMSGIDPRVVRLDLKREDRFQEPVLLDYPGENFFHDPPLSTLVDTFGPPGIIDGGKPVPEPVHREPIDPVAPVESSPAEAGQAFVMDGKENEPAQDRDETVNFDDQG